jgi:uncharacterized protein YbjT (DUF2867 family)
MSGKILVVGSTGKVGSAVAEELSSQGERVKGATREPDLHLADGVEYVRLDLRDPATFQPALRDVDKLFLLSPPEAHADRLLGPFLDAAARKVERVVLMTANGVETSDEVPMRKVEIALERSGVPCTILRPTWFMQNFHTVWLQTIKSTGSIQVPAAQARTAFIDTRDIADCAVAALTQDGFGGKAYNLSGGEALTYGEAAAILTRETGRHVSYAPLDDETFYGGLVNAGLPPDYAAMMVTLFQSVRAGGAQRVTDSVRRLTGRSPRTLEAYAREFRHLFADFGDLRTQEMTSEA